MKRFAAISLACAFLLSAAFVPAQGPPGKKPADKDVGKTAIKTNPNVPSLISEIGGKSFDQWKNDLLHADPSVRAEAILMISQFGSATVEAVPLLLQRCRDQDASPRVKAVLALSFVEIGERDVPKVIDELATLAGNDTQSIVRYQAAVALEQRFADHPHTRSAKVVTNLLRGAGDSTAWEIRRVCLSTLRRCGRDPQTGPEPRVVQAMLRALRDQTSRVRLEATTALGSMGRPNDPMLLAQVDRALQGVLRDRDKSVGIWAQVSLMALADKVPDNALETLAKGLSSSDTRIRAQTTRAIGMLKERGKPCLSALLKALEDKDREVILEACIALVNVGDRGPKVMDALTELSKNKEVEEGTREYAKLALEQLKKPVKPLKP